MSSLDVFRFANPVALVGFLIIPAIALILRFVPSLRKVATLRYADVGIVPEGRSWRVALFPFLRLLQWLGLGLLIVGLARPQSGRSETVIQGEGVDIALVLDISGSMKEDLDFAPNSRLEAAKIVIDEFVEQREFDRLGLVVFAESAFVQAPLTIDHAVLKRLLRDVKPAVDVQLDDGTAIGMGIVTAVNMLVASEAESKVIILLTDGANTRGNIEPMTAADIARTLGIRVYTIGMGRVGVSRNLDENTLKGIAQETGGIYFQADNSLGLRQVYADINRLERSDIEITTFNDYQELGNWVILPGVLLILEAMVLNHTVFRRIP